MVPEYTGTVYSREELEGLTAILAKASERNGRPLYLVVDEPYRFLAFDGVEVPSLLPMYPYAVLASSFSKNLCLAGERVGFIALSPLFAERAELMGGLTLANRILGFVNPPVVGQHIMAGALGSQVDVNIYARRREMMGNVLSDAGYEFQMPKGAFYFFPKAPGGDDVAFVIFPLELNTMPGFAGSSAYYLRYMDPHNAQALVSEKADHYWQNVDLYVGGTEHATGHLIYSRFWNKFLHDLGVSIKEEPFQKLVNQGMIQGRSNFVYRIKDTNTFVSLNLKDQYETTPLHVDVNIVSNDILDVEAFKAWRPEYNDAEFILEDGKYICGWAVEKMSKSMYNVVNPDMIVEKYGADTLRMYEMFLGPVEQSKPWDTNGIDGVHRFLKKLWNLFYSRTDEFLPVEGEPTKEELKAIHKLIKKVTLSLLLCSCILTFNV